MAAEDVLAEAVARIEHKLDLVLEFLAQTVGPTSKGFLLTPLGDPKHTCPVCTQPVQYNVDVLKRVVARKCGCATGKLPPPDLSQFTAPQLPVKETRYGEPGSGGEDGTDPDSRRRRGDRSR